MKILFLTRFDFIESKNDGGAICAFRNYSMLSNIYGKENIVLCILTPDNKPDSNNIKYFKSTRNIFLTYLTYIHLGEKYTIKSKNKIINFICSQDVDKIFFDGSTFGQIIKNNYIKHLDNIVFFHNVERQYTWEQVKKHNILCIFRYISASYNEKLMSKYGKKFICLNDRDNQLIKKYYKIKPNLLLPITLTDSFSYPMVNCPNNIGSRVNLLYVGSYLAHNYTGLIWFIEKVMPYVNAYLTIIGKDMEKLKSKIGVRDNINIAGTVKELQSYYIEADAVVMPIFMGGGMKVKTAEALMYGKNIFASKEALEGYDTKNVNGIYVCNTAEEFIREINSFSDNSNHCKFTDEIRQLFLKKYCTQNYYEPLKELLGYEKT